MADEKEELAAKIEELELISLYGNPAEAAKAARELAKIKSSELYETFKAEMDISDKHFSGAPKKPNNGLKNSVKNPLHKPSELDNALRGTLGGGYTNSEIKRFHYDNPTKR